MDPTWAPEVEGFLFECLVAQCEQSPSVTLTLPAFSAKHPHIDELLLASFSIFLPLSAETDGSLSTDLQLKQLGLDFTGDLRPPSPHASETDGPPVGNGLRAACQRINFHPSVLGGRQKM